MLRAQKTTPSRKLHDSSCSVALSFGAPRISYTHISPIHLLPSYYLPSHIYLLGHQTPISILFTVPTSQLPHQSFFSTQRPGIAPSFTVAPCVKPLQDIMTTANTRTTGSPGPLYRIRQNLPLEQSKYYFNWFCSNNNCDYGKVLQTIDALQVEDIMG